MFMTKRKIKAQVKGKCQCTESKKEMQKQNYQQTIFDKRTIWKKKHMMIRHLKKYLSSFR
ncbi:hypothetical protein CHISP_1562 [Chitinispirillum alkaliphilum]|nr:hypothetical protein CHISP_1562 [Chitinispirillum alkaliphilum]